MSLNEDEAHRAWASDDLARAFNCFRLGANDGQLGCMMDLGYFYDEGLGICETSWSGYRFSKQAGSASCCHTVGITRRRLRCFPFVVEAGRH